MTLPLILTMIVRDEAATIAKTLESCRGIVDGFAIVDTGSSDDTVEVVKAACRAMDIPGRIAYLKWPESFSVARSHAWDVAAAVAAMNGWEPHWRFELSGDTVVHGSWDVAFCGTSAADGLWVESRMGNITWRRPKVTRSGRGWRYRGRLHEIAELPGANLETARGLWLEHRGRPQGLPAQGGRSKYLSMMLADLEENPDDPRTVFYAAQTLELEGRWGEARALYEQRIRMGAEGKGWNQEAYIAALRVARRARDDGWPQEDLLPLFVRAIAICPERLEALDDLREEVRIDYGHDEWLFHEVPIYMERGE